MRNLRKLSETGEITSVEEAKRLVEEQLVAAGNVVSPAEVGGNDSGQLGPVENGGLLPPPLNNGLVGAWLPVLSLDCLEPMLLTLGPARLATRLQVVCLTLAKRTQDAEGRRELRLAAKHFGHVEMERVPTDLLGGGAQ